jgi:hypothetical protein
MYTWFFAPNTSGSGTATLGGGEFDRSVDDEEKEGDIDQRVE